MQRCKLLRMFSLMLSIKSKSLVLYGFTLFFCLTLTFRRFLLFTVFIRTKNSQSAIIKRFLPLIRAKNCTEDSVSTLFYKKVFFWYSKKVLQKYPIFISIQGQKKSKQTAIWMLWYFQSYLPLIIMQLIIVEQLLSFRQIKFFLNVL